MSHVGDTNHRLVITKSLTSLALPAIVDAKLPNACFTPLLGRDAVKAALEAARAPSLLLGATGDSTWDAEIVARLDNGQVLEIEGSNHVLTQPGDPIRSLDILRKATNAVLSFLDEIPM